MSLPGVTTQETLAMRPRHTFKGHTDRIWGVICIPEKQRFITSSGDGSLRLWNAENGLQIGKDWKDGESAVKAIALSPDMKTVASGSGDYAVRLWDVDTEKVVAKWTGHSKSVWSVCWSRDGQRILSGSHDGTVRVCDVVSGKTILGPIETGHEYVLVVAYSPDQTVIATCGGDKLIKIWDAKTFEPVATLKGHTDDVNCLTWTADGKTLFSGSDDDCIMRWNTITWKQIAVFTAHSSTIYAIAISPSQCILASASLDHTVRLWNIEDDQSISSPLQHPDLVGCVSFSADGALLAIGCGDNNAYTWDVAAILREAGLDHLLLHSAELQAPQDPARKSVLNADATRGLAKPPNTTRSLPLGFIDDTWAEHHIHAPSTGPHPRSSAPRLSALHPRALIDRFSSLFVHHHAGVRNATSHGRPTSLFRSTLAHFSRHHRSDGKRPPPEVEVPCVKGNPRNIYARAKSKHVTDPSNIMMLTVDGPSRPPNSSQSDEDACDQNSSSQSQLPVNPTPAAPAVAATTMTATATPSHPEPASDIRQTGCWARFWLFACCISTETHK